MKLQELIKSKKRSIKYRKRILELSQKVSALHLGGTFSCTEIMDLIFNVFLNKKNLDCFVMSKGQRRKFYGCSAWPDCNFISNAKPIEHPCPECNGLMVESTRDRVICYDKDCAITLNANELKTDPKLIVPFNAS